MILDSEGWHNQFGDRIDSEYEFSDSFHVATPVNGKRKTLGSLSQAKKYINTFHKYKRLKWTKEK